jgi:hypothetical protein
MFLSVIGTKILGLLLHAIHSHLRQLILLPPMVFLDLRFLHQQLKMDGGLAMYTLSLCLPLKVVLFFILLLFIDINTSFHHRNNN